MLSAYLWLNCGLYVIFALWCTLRPEQTSTFLGLDPRGWKGLSEYVAVYGGLEAGLAAFFGLAALRPTFQEPALWLAALLYGGLVVFRSIVWVRSGFAIGTSTGALALELALGLVAVVLLIRAT